MAHVNASAARIHATPLAADSSAPTGRSPHTATVDGVRLAYDEVEGAEPTVVCLHAIGHDARDFAHFAERLGGRHRVLALDWPGQGRSATDRQPASAARYEQLLEGFLDVTGVARAVLIGNSIGGAAAIRYAAAHPDRIAALVLENPGGLAALDWVSRRAINAMVRFFNAGTRQRWWYRRAFALYYRQILQRPAAAWQRERIVASAVDLAPVLRDAWRSFGEPAADIRALAPRIQCPVLFAWAERDRIVQLRRSLPAIQQFRNARLERFPAGHAPHLEAPEEFTTTVERFLADLPRPT